MSLLSEYTDAQLFARVKTDDHAAFTEIYERYWSVLFIHAFKIIENEEKAMDVVQDNSPNQLGCVCQFIELL
ncbi:hypothetical protein GQF61_11645 [Sphingobacterium sp. DK4209]|uniref:RNA polymerase sigma-70 region 2 domain-containing protein n=1 Tax=Sphingobacterium zhuxiongii TaxID=2662364 RepID=A0A5Q0QIM4_9SPHI|nr:MULTISPECIES: hypothetical protein [unclassified Sphingobacterium]MVZ66514.1 hypothetical protein [Sphingobacterium sp. DK4209]QGA27832.1 hypothetical protein GFH32_16545 [Sphingobacterium sp. dk4302]